MLNNKPKKILLVDDDPLVLLAVKGMLSRLGCEVLTATNGSNALKILGERSKDNDGVLAAIIDANMPVMNGYETAAEISERVKRKELAPLHLVCLSAQDSMEHREMCKQSGMEHISKNIFNISSAKAVFIGNVEEGSKFTRITLVINK